MKTRQTIVIIGAGSSGLSTAYELSKHDHLKVIVIEKKHVGSGQTGQCCGFVRSYYNTAEMITSAVYSAKKIKKLCAEKPELKFTRKGLLVIDSINNKLQVKHNVDLLNNNNATAIYLEGKEINKIHPHLKSDSICAGYDIDAGYINPLFVVNYLKSRCLANRVEIHENEEVIYLEKISEQFVIHTNKQIYKANKVVNATAAYTNNINNYLDISLPIKVIKINNSFYRLPIEVQGCQVAVADFVEGFYLIPHTDFIDVSTITLDLKNIIDPEIESFKFRHESIEEFLEIISKRIPKAKGASKQGGFSSCIDISPDYYPLIGGTEVNGYYVATGFSGTGFKHFPMIGLIMSELILKKELTYPNIVEFLKVDRFQDRNLKRSKVSDSYYVNE